VRELAAIGAITSTVAALLRKGVTAIAATRISASARNAASVAAVAEPAGDQLAAAGRPQRIETGIRRRA
jgi:hypothetical protein